MGADVGPGYPAVALAAIGRTPVPRLLQERAAIAFERIAHGAGMTNWYCVAGPEQLEQVARRLSPGSSLSFYFDGRIATAPLDDHVVDELARVAREDHGAVLGRHGEDGIEIVVDYVAGRGDIEYFWDEYADADRVFFGRVPGRDDDGVDAVTLDLPDRDGVVRPHPH